VLAARMPNSLTQTAHYFGILKSAGLRTEEEWLLGSATDKCAMCLCNIGAEKAEIYSKVCKGLGVT
jgi:hypothetical protein